MEHQTIEEASLIDELKATQITLGVVIKSTVEDAARLLAQIKNDDAFFLVFCRKSPGMLYVTNKDPRPRRHP